MSGQRRDGNMAILFQASRGNNPGNGVRDLCWNHLLGPGGHAHDY